MGCDSILTVQVVARSRKIGIRFQPRQLFEHQILAELAPVVDAEGLGAAYLRRRGRDGACGSVNPEGDLRLRIGSAANEHYAPDEMIAHSYRNMTAHSINQH
ncbi:MAG: hypothetical protein GY842_20210 [bacterium]|nr:hypothetical protein [bacterium]